VIFSVVLPTESCALRSTQPLKVSTRDFSWGKAGLCFWLTNYHPCSAETSRKSGDLTYPEPLGPLLPVAGDLYFLFFFTSIFCDYFHHFFPTIFFSFIIMLHCYRNTPNKSVNPGTLLFCICEILISSLGRCTNCRPLDPQCPFTAHTD